MEAAEGGGGVVVVEVANERGAAFRLGAPRVGDRLLALEFLDKKGEIQTRDLAR